MSLPVLKKILLGDWLILIALLGAVVLRIAAGMGDLGMDEIWSLNNAMSVQSIREIFTVLHIDNNHILNSSFMYLLGDLDTEQWYRFPALIGGSIALVYSCLIALRNGRVSAIIMLVLMGYSYLFILYSSEARGYGTLMACVVIGYYYGLRILEDADWNWNYIIVLWLIIILGFLSHITFIHFYLGLLLWSIDKIRREKIALQDKLLKLTKLHLLPLLFFLWYYWIFISRLEIGGGPQYTLLPVVEVSAAYLLGIHGTIVSTPVMPVILILAVMITLVLYYKNTPSLRLMYVWSIFLSPVLLFIFFPSFIYVRYFLVSLVLLLFPLCELLSQLYSKNIAGKSACMVFMAVFLLGHFVYLNNFYQYRRGNYSGALEFVLSSSTAGPVTIGSDFDFRNATIINYYAARIQNGERIQYIYREEWEDQAPTYFVGHNIGTLLVPPAMTTINSYNFEFLKAFPYNGGPSGWHWYIYKKK